MQMNEAYIGRSFSIELKGEHDLINQFIVRMLWEKETILHAFFSVMNASVTAVEEYCSIATVSIVLDAA